jgi:hypothetical protein
MSIEVARYQFFFNSSKGLTDVSQDSFNYFKVYLNRNLTLVNPDNHFELTIEKVSIPFCFSQFAFANLSSVLQYRIDDPLGSIYFGSISIPDGNYSVFDMGNTIANLLPADIMTNIPSITNCTIEWQYDPPTNRFRMKILGSLYLGNVWELILSPCPITVALGFDNQNPQQVTSFNVNDPFVTGIYNVNMNPIPEIYVVSSTLTDNNAFQCFPSNAVLVEASVTSIVAVVHLDHPAPYYIYKDFNNPIKIPLDRNSIDTIDFDLRDYDGNPLYGSDQSWNITFHISEISNDAVRQQQLKTFINPISPPIDQVDFLERKLTQASSPVQNTTDSLETLKQRVNESLEKLRTDVQKRKNPTTSVSTVYESSIGTKGPTNSQPTLTSSNSTTTEQTTPDLDVSAKRQRES